MHHGPSSGTSNHARRLVSEGHHDHHATNYDSGHAHVFVFEVESIAELQAAVGAGRLCYIGDIHYNDFHDGADSIGIHISDNGFTGAGGSLQGTLDPATVVSVVAANDRPTLTVLSEFHVSEDVPTTILHMDLEDVDVDECWGDGEDACLWTITVKTSYGTVHLDPLFNRPLTSVTPTERTPCHHEFSITGRFYDVTDALLHFEYLSDLHHNEYHGPEFLEIVACDNGNVGTGGEQCHPVVTRVHVHSVNDRPLWHTEGGVTFSVTSPASKCSSLD